MVQNSQMQITWNETRQRFEASTTYAERSTANPALKSAGFAFDGLNKLWHTAGYKQPKPYLDQVRIAAKLEKFLTVEAKARIAENPQASAEAIASINAENQRQNAIQASRAEDANVTIPVPDGLEYLPYQRAGIAYASSHVNTLIADEMGLGKTIQAIGTSNMLPDAESILVVCPATLKLNWKREWLKWDVKHLTVGIATSKSVPDTQVVIVNYDILEKLGEVLRSRKWDILIADECHKCKNPKTKRTQFLLGKYTWQPEHRQWNTDVPPIDAKHRLFLTGTPIVNRPVELWSMIRVMDPQGLGRYKSKFEQRYCGAHFNGYGFERGGATNLPELQDRLRASFMVRRLKMDVLKELPAKRYQVQVLEIEGADELVKRENTLVDSLKGAGVKESKVEFSELSAVRSAIAEMKIPFVINEITDMLESVDKLVVFAHHHKVIEAIQQAFPGSVCVYGETSMDDRQKAVDAFQNDSQVRLFIGSIQAAGVGLTLTAASTVLFAELDWVPGNMTQAEDRCHRIGQTESVLIKYLVLDNSTDARMAHTLVSKERVIKAGLDDETTNEMPQVGDFKNSNKIVRTKVIDGEEKTEEIEINISESQMRAILAGLRSLAGMCDGAFAVDGMGFNKLDTAFGKKLASQIMLTPKQAYAGQRLVQKYQGQLPTQLVIDAGITPKGK